MLNRRSFLKWTGLAATTAILSPTRSSAAESSKKPNIIFILSDDYGIGGVGCYGADRYKTPNLDTLAQTGVRFETCLSMPLCGPSRGVFMTGRYPFRTGLINNGAGSQLSPDKEVPIARIMKEAGYATAVAGKWRQLQYFSTKEDAQQWGFDEFLIWGIGGGQPERYWDPVYNKNGQPLADAKGKYGPDLLHEFVVDFIRRHRDEPFFVYYPTPLIHAPILRTPDSAAQGSDLYADNIAYLDKLMGKLVAELDGMGLRDKTLIVFVGDNGCTPRASGSTATGQRSGGILHGRAIEGAKGDLTEGGSRVPLICNWKGTTPAGQVSKDLVDFSDFFPTFAELAGATLPAGVTIDGHSFAPQLQGRPGKPREWVFVQLDQNWYVRDAQWKLNQAGELFDMKDAPFAQVPASADSNDAKAAKARLQAALDALSPQVTTSALKPAQKKSGKKASKKRQK